MPTSMRMPSTSIRPAQQSWATKSLRSSRITRSVAAWATWSTVVDHPLDPQCRAIFNTFHTEMPANQEGWNCQGTNARLLPVPHCPAAGNLFSAEDFAAEPPCFAAFDIPAFHVEPSRHCPASDRALPKQSALGLRAKCRVLFPAICSTTFRQA
jgi:hypothetical protein